MNNVGIKYKYNLYRLKINNRGFFFYYLKENNEIYLLGGFLYHTILLAKFRKREEWKMYESYNWKDCNKEIEIFERFLNTNFSEIEKLENCIQDVNIDFKYIKEQLEISYDE